MFVRPVTLVQDAIKRETNPTTFILHHCVQILNVASFSCHKRTVLSNLVHSDTFDAAMDGWTQDGGLEAFELIISCSFLRDPMRC